jgi:hypothetical protein
LRIAEFGLRIPFRLFFPFYNPQSAIANPQ